MRTDQPILCDGEDGVLPVSDVNVKGKREKGLLTIIKNMLPYLPESKLKQ